MRAALVLIASITVGCSASPSRDVDAARDDAFVVPIDAARYDAGPPVCTGTPAPCAGRAHPECTSGCFHRTCFGDPYLCSHWRTSTDCYAHECEWDNSIDFCSGPTVFCSSFSDEAVCRDYGCDYVTTEPCEGTPRACTSLTAAECAHAPGCMAAGADGGVDAGESDAATADAAVVDAAVGDAGSCRATGCHPLYDASCRCGYSATTADWACGRSGTGGVGAACDTTAMCGAGLFCSRRTNDARGQCRRLCDEDADCATGEGCASVGNFGVSCAGMCLPLAQCNLDTQNCPAGQSCYWLHDTAAMREHQFCNRTGTITGVSLCFDDPTACAEGSICARVILSSRCTPICSTDGDCSGGYACTGTTASGSRFCQ